MISKSSNCVNWEYDVLETFGIFIFFNLWEFHSHFSYKIHSWGAVFLFIYESLRINVNTMSAVIEVKRRWVCITEFLKVMVSWGSQRSIDLFLVHKIWIIKLSRLSSKIGKKILTNSVQLESAFGEYDPRSG